MTVEEKILEKIRKTLLADTIINDLVETRIYPAHISLIPKAIFPAISIHIMQADKRFSEAEVVDVFLQIDSWFPVSNFNHGTIYDVQQQIRNLLHRQNLSDTTIGLIMMQSMESSSGPMLVDPNSKLYHYPTRYRMAGI